MWRNINTVGDMSSSRRNGQTTDLHNNHTFSTLMRTTTRASSSSSSRYPRHTTRSKTTLNETLPFRLPSATQVCIKKVIYLYIYRKLKNVMQSFFFKYWTLFRFVGWKSWSWNWTTSSCSWWWSFSWYTFTWIKIKK